MIYSISNHSPVHIHMVRKRSVWYSVKDGNWNDPNTWISNGLAKSIFAYPQANDDVHILHNVNYNQPTSSTFSINNLFIRPSGTFTSTSVNAVLSIKGIIDSRGILMPNSNLVIGLSGYYNYIEKSLYFAGTSNLRYEKDGDQVIMDLNYNNLSTRNSGIKYQQSNLDIAGFLEVGIGGSIRSEYEIGANSLTVRGTTQIGQGPSRLAKTLHGGTIIFVGGISTGDNGIWDFSGNDDIEFRGGFPGGYFGTFITGTGKYKFTTNNQTIFGASAYGVAVYDMEIAADIVVTSTGVLHIINSATGLSSTSRLDVAGTSIVKHYTDTPVMPVGIYNWNISPASSLHYLAPYSHPLPYTNYYNVSVGNGGPTGKKYLNKNTTFTSFTLLQTSVAGNTFDCAGFEFYNSGITSCGQGTNFIKTSPVGKVTFIGKFAMSSGTQVIFTGVCDVEMRAGYDYYSGAGTLGDGTINFIGSQSLGGNGILGLPNVVISAGDTLTLSSGGAIINGVLNGASSLSVFDNRSTVGLNYKNATAPMLTGILQLTAAPNLFLYSLNGAQDIKGGNYSSLTLNTGGVKKLLGNINVAVTYLVSAPATINLNGFTKTP